jgi:uncharacterized protein
MYSRLNTGIPGKSLFLLGPRGTGKTTWARSAFPGALFLDLLEARLFNDLMADPQRLETLIPHAFTGTVILDEVQKVPAILDEVHRLIENRKIQFILTGSSARKLRRAGPNLLAGRALTQSMHPLTAVEMGSDFEINKALRHGLLPSIGSEPEPALYLESYVTTYLKEEVRQEGMTRNISSFARFLEAASFSQGSVLNMSAVARECAVDRKTVESYFEILQDLMLAHAIHPFTKRAKRRLTSHPKFYFFDVGIFRTIRPSGPLDTPETAEGPAFETLFLQNLIAVNEALRLGYDIHYWRTSNGTEVDFIAYGPKGFFAFEVKSGSRIRDDAFTGLKSFVKDYPEARLILVYGGERKRQFDAIEAWPMVEMLKELPHLLQQGG